MTSSASALPSARDNFMARKRYNNTTSDVPEENFKKPPTTPNVELTEEQKVKLEKKKKELGIVELSLEDMLKQAIRNELRKG